MNLNRSDVLHFFLMPLFLVMNCLTIKSDVALHHFFTGGFVLMVFLMVLDRGLKEKDFRFIFRGQKYFVLLLLLGGWMIISALFSDYTLASLKSALRSNLFFLILYFLSLTLTTRKHYDMIFNTFFVISFIVALGVIYEYLTELHLFVDGEAVRYGGFIKVENIAAYIIAIGTVCVFPKVGKRKYLLILVVLNAMALFLTLSRSAWLMFAIACLIYLLYTFRIKDYQIYYLTILVLIVVIGVVMREAIYDVARLKYGISHRDYLWSGALRMFQDNVFFGVGSGNFQHFIRDYIVGVDENSLLWKILSYGFTHAHSLVLTNLAELGLPGGGIVLSLLIIFLVFFLKKRKNFHPYLLIGKVLFIGFIVRSIFESGGFLSNGWFAFDIYMWLIIIISLNLTQIRNDNPKIN